jgi:hypothetical protein
LSPGFYTSIGIRFNQERAEGKSSGDKPARRQRIRNKRGLRMRPVLSAAEGIEDRHLLSSIFDFRSFRQGFVASLLALSLHLAQ